MLNIRMCMAIFFTLELIFKESNTIVLIYRQAWCYRLHRVTRVPWFKVHSRHQFALLCYCRPFWLWQQPSVHWSTIHGDSNQTAFGLRISVDRLLYGLIAGDCREPVVVLTLNWKIGRQLRQNSCKEETLKIPYKNPPDEFLHFSSRRKFIL